MHTRVKLYINSDNQNNIKCPSTFLNNYEYHMYYFSVLIFKPNNLLFEKYLLKKCICVSFFGLTYCFLMCSLSVWILFGATVYIRLQKSFQFNRTCWTMATNILTEHSTLYHGVWWIKFILLSDCLFDLYCTCSMYIKPLLWTM